MSAIQLPYGFKLGNAAPVDFYYGPHNNNILTDVSALNTAIDTEARYVGQIIGIKSIDNSSVTPYIFKTGTTQADLKKLVDETTDQVGSGTVDTNNFLDKTTYTIVSPYDGTTIPIPSGSALNKYTLYLNTTTNVFSYYNGTNLISIEPKFNSLITVNLKDNRTFGNYSDGDTIPSGTPVRDVLKNALQFNDPPVPSISVSPLTVKYAIVDQTITPQITLGKTVGTAGSITGAKLTKNTGSGETEISGIDTTTTSHTDSSITVSANNTTSPIVTYSYDIQDANYAFNQIQNVNATITQLSYAPLRFTGLSSNITLEVGNYSYAINGNIVSNNYNNHTSIYPEKYRILRDSTEIVAETTLLGTNQSKSITQYSDTNSQNTPATINYYISATDTTTANAVTSSAMAVTFKYKIYYGQLDNFDINSPSFTGLSSEFTTSGESTLTVSVNKKDVVFALPPGVTFNSIKANGFSINTQSIVKSITINTTANVNYNIYHIRNSVAPDPAVPYAITFTV